MSTQNDNPEELAQLRVARHGNARRSGEYNDAASRDDHSMNAYHHAMYLDELLRVGEAARVLHVHPDTLRAWVDSGKVAGVRYPNGERRIRRSALLALVEGVAS